MADLFEEDSFFHIRMESDEESDLSGDEHKFDPTGADAAAMTYLSPEARAEYLVGCGAEDFENDIDKARRLSKQTLEEEKFKRMEDRAIRKSLRAEKRRLRAEKESGYIQRQPVDQSRREEEDLFRSIVDRQKQQRGTHISPVNNQQSHRTQPHVHNYESNVSHHRPSPNGEQHQQIGTLTMDALAIHNVIHESKKYHNFSEHIIETLDKDPELEAALRISEIEAAKHNSQQNTSNATSGRGNMGRAHTHTYNNAGVSGSGPGVGAPVRISPRANSYKPPPTQDSSMQRSLYESELEEALRRSQEEAEAAAAVAAITALEEQQEVQQVRNGTSVPHSNPMHQPVYQRKPSAKMSSSEPPVRLNSFNSRENVSPARNLGSGPSGGDVHFHHHGSFDDELEQALRLSLMEQEQNEHHQHHQYHHNHSQHNNNSSNINGSGTGSGGHNSAQHSHFTSPARLLSPLDVQQQQQRIVSPANQMVSPSMQGIAAGRHNNHHNSNNHNNQSGTYTAEQLRLQALEAAQVSVLLAKTKSESVREHREHKSSSPSLMNQMSFNSSTGKLTHQSTSSSGKLTHQSSIGSSGVGAAGERYTSPGNLPLVSDDPGLNDPAVQRFMEARALKKQASKNEALRKEILNEVHHLEDNDIIENVDISVPLMPAVVHGVVPAVSDKGRNQLGSVVLSHSRTNSLFAVNQPGNQPSSQSNPQASFVRPVLTTQESLALSSDGDYSPLLSPMGVNIPVNNNLYSPGRGIYADYTQHQHQQQMHGTPQHIAAQPPSVHVFSAEVAAEHTQKAQQVRGLTRGPALIEIPLTPGRQPPVSRQNSDESSSQPSPSGHGRNPSHSSVDGQNYQSQAHGHLGPLQLMSSHQSAQHSVVHSAAHSAYGSAQPSAQHSAQHSRQSSNEFQRQLSNESTLSAVVSDTISAATTGGAAATTVLVGNSNAGSTGRPIRPSSAGNFIQRSKPSTKQLSDSPVTTPASGVDDHDISPRTPGTGTPQHTASGTGTPQHTASPNTPHTQTKRPSGVFIQRSRRPSALSEDVQTTETDTKNPLNTVMNTHNTLQTQFSTQNTTPSTPQTAPLTTSKSRRSSQSDPNHSAVTDSVNNTPTTAGFGVAAYEEEPMYSIDELPVQQPVQQYAQPPVQQLPQQQHHQYLQPVQQFSQQQQYQQQQLPVQQPVQPTVTYEAQMEVIARRSRSNSRVEPLPLNPGVQQPSRSRANSRVFLDSQNNIQQQQEQQMQYNQYLMQNQQQNQQQQQQYSSGNISRQHSGEQYGSYSGGSPKSVSPRSPLPYDQQQQPSRLVFQNLSRSRDDDNDSRSEMSCSDSKCDSKSVHSGSSSNTPRSTGSVRKQLQPARIQQQQQQMPLRTTESGPTTGMRPEAAATYFQHPHNNSEPSSRLNTNNSAALTTETTETFENYELQPLGQLQNPSQNLAQNPAQNHQHQGGQGEVGPVVDHTALQQEEKLASAISLLTQAMQTMTPTAQQQQNNINNANNINNNSNTNNTNNNNNNNNSNNSSNNPASAMEAAVHLLKEAMTTPAATANEEPHDPHSAALAAARVLLANLNISTAAAPRSSNSHQQSQQQYQQVGTSPAAQPGHHYHQNSTNPGGQYQNHPRLAESDSPAGFPGQHYGHPRSTESDSPGFPAGQQPGYNVPLSTFSMDSYGASNANTPHHQGFSEDPSPYRGIATEISSSNRFSGNNTPQHIATTNGKTPRSIPRLPSTLHNNESPHLPLPPAIRAGTTTAPYYVEGLQQQQQPQHGLSLQQTQQTQAYANVETQSRLRTASRDYRDLSGREMSIDDRDTSRDSFGPRNSLGPRDRESLGQHPGYSHTDTSGRLTSATSERSSLQPSPHMFHGTYNNSNVGSRDYYDPHSNSGGGQSGPGDLYAVSPPPQVHVFQHNSMPQLGHMRPITIDTHDPRTNNHHQQQQPQQQQQQYTPVHHNTPHNTPHHHNQQQQGLPLPYYAQQSSAYGAPSPQHHGQWVPDSQQYQQSVPHHQPQGMTPHARSNVRLAENTRPDLLQHQNSYDPTRQHDPRADFQHSKSYTETPSHQMYGQPEVPYYADPAQQQQQLQHQQSIHAHRTPRTSFRQGTTPCRPSQPSSHDMNGAGAPLPNTRSGRMISPVVLGPAMTSGGVSVASKDSVGGNWECSICTLMNEATFLTCDACGSTKNPKI